MQTPEHTTPQLLASTTQPSLVDVLPPELLPSITQWLDRDSKRAARLVCQALRHATDASVHSLELCIVKGQDWKQHVPMRMQARAAGFEVRLPTSLPHVPCCGS